MKLTCTKRLEYWKKFNEIEKQFYDIKTIVQKEIDFKEQDIKKQFYYYLDFMQKINNLFNQLMSDITKE